MRARFSASSITTMFQRLRDPQMQVWVMAGVSVLLVLIGHLHAWNPSGEGKNNTRPSASRLLLAGARIDWSEDFGAAAPRQESRPVLVLGTDPLAHRKRSGPAISALRVRPAMQMAAGSPWRALDRPLRQQFSEAGIPASPIKIILRWSGDARGNAALISKRQALAAAPQNTTPARIVIGNGSRSGDGEIELLSPNFSLKPGVVEITLIGSAGRNSPSQLAALAELLVHLEALSGHCLQSLAASPASTSALKL